MNGNLSSGGSGINLFANPNAVFSEFRPLILGYDNNASGAGPIRGFPTFNLDATVSKEIRATEKVGATLSILRLPTGGTRVDCALRDAETLVESDANGKDPD